MRPAAAALVLAAALGACAGPSKARLHDLLGQCREANRERGRMLKAYEDMDCKAHPEQTFGALEGNVGGF